MTDVTDIDSMTNAISVAVEVTNKEIVGIEVRLALHTRDAAQSPTTQEIEEEEETEILARAADEVARGDITTEELHPAEA